jgi:hypothetical protein
MVTVDVAPAQGEQLTESEAAEQSHSQRQLVRPTAQCVEQQACLFRREGADLRVGHHGSIDRVDRIHLEGLPSDGVRHRAMENVVDLLDAGGTQTPARTPVA